MGNDFWIIATVGTIVLLFLIIFGTTAYVLITRQGQKEIKAEAARASLKWQNEGPEAEVVYPPCDYIVDKELE